MAGHKAKVSWLHRVLRMEPGKVPVWLLSSAGCGCDGACTILAVVDAAFVIGVLWVGGVRSQLDVFAIAAWVGGVVFWGAGDFAIEKARRVERFARAQRRRGDSE